MSEECVRRGAFARARAWHARPSLAPRAVPTGHGGRRWHTHTHTHTHRHTLYFGTQPDVCRPNQRTFLFTMLLPLCCVSVPSLLRTCHSRGAHTNSPNTCRGCTGAFPVPLGALRDCVDGIDSRLAHPYSSRGTSLSSLTVTPRVARGCLHWWRRWDGRRRGCIVGGTVILL